MGVDARTGLRLQLRRPFMELLPKELRDTIPRIYSTEKDEDPIVRVKFFTPWSIWSWFVLEGLDEDGDYLMFGHVEGPACELGYFHLSELESITGPGGLKVERDL